MQQVKSASGLLSTKQLAERLGLRRYQLTYLIDQGVIAEAAVRSGTRRMFSPEEVARAIQTVEQIRQARQQLQTAAAVRRKEGDPCPS